MERRKIVTLLITQSCNLRCTYCYLRQYDGGQMTEETAQAVIKRAFAEDADQYDMLDRV